jgi:transcriptional regulator with GAF, ATPase, and Fis domain
VLTSSETLTSDTLPEDILSSERKSGNTNFNLKIDEFKRQLIVDALEKNNWVQKKASKDLGLKATTLSELMKRLNVQK